MDNPKETVSYTYNRTDMHINSQRLGQHAQIQTRQGSTAKKGKQTGAHIPNPDSISNRQPLANGKLTFSSELHWVYKPHLRAGFMPNSRWPRQNVLDIMVSDFVGFFWGVCVCFMSAPPPIF